jgi:hypothetical protein
MTDTTGSPIPDAVQEGDGPEPMSPPSLRKIAPTRITLSCSGACVPMTGRNVHLVAGRAFTVEVQMRGSTTNVEITAEPPMLTIATTTRIVHGTDATYQATFSAGKSYLRILPIPRSTHLHVTVTDGQNEPQRFTIPVKIWPPISSYGLSALLAFLGIVGLRLERVFAQENSFDEIVSAIITDLPRFGLIGLACLLIPPVAWLIGRIINTE